MAAKKKAGAGAGTNTLTLVESAQKEAETAAPVLANGAQTLQPVVSGYEMNVDPDDVLTDPEVKALREWTGSTAHELRIPDLANTIWTEKQYLACLTRTSEDGIVMVDGERRKAAIKYIREHAEEFAGDPAGEHYAQYLHEAQTMQLRISVQEMDADQGLRATMLAFTQRADQTAGEFLKSIKFLRARYPEFRKTTVGSTEGLAAYLGVSPATISQAERLEQLPADVMEKVNSGRWSATTALELVTTPAEKVPEVAAAAQELANKEATEKKKQKAVRELVKTTDFVSDAVKNKKKNKGKDQPTTETLPASDVYVVGVDETVEGVRITVEPVAEPDPEQAQEVVPIVDEADTNDATSIPDMVVEPVTDAPVKSKHVRQAQRDIPGAMPKPKAARMADAVSIIEPGAGPAYPKVMADFAGRFCDFASGKGSNPVKALEKAWDAIAEAIEKGASGGGKGKGKKATTPTPKAVKPVKSAPVKKVAAPKAKSASAKKATAPAKKKAATSKPVKSAKA